MVRGRALGVATLWLLAGACGKHQAADSRSDARTDTIPKLSATTCGAYESFHLDADGDGYGDVNVRTLCVNGHVPVGYVANWDDCDDRDPTRWRLSYRDADGDGVGVADITICAGAATPPGYVFEIGVPDCDDANPAIAQPYLVDADGDGVPPPNAGTVCGPPDKPPPGSVPISFASDPGDCDDNDPNLRTLYYRDQDGDGFAASTEVSVCGNPDRGPPPGYGLFMATSPDCDDSRPDVNPDAIELWSDDLDSDCDGSPLPYRNACGDAGACQPAPDLPIDPTCAVADLAITDILAEPICYGVLWQVTIANLGTQSVQSFRLRIDSAAGPVTYTLHELIAPGVQYPYRIPDRLHVDGAPRFPTVDLRGEVQFTVVPDAADCTAANDTRSAAATPIQCLIDP